MRSPLRRGRGSDGARRQSRSSGSDASWSKVEWHRGEPYPCVGFIVSNLGVSSTRTRLLCRTFAANAARLQLHALTDNRGNFLRITGE